MAVIQYQKGNIFDSTTQVIVNTVNCKGVMGKGLALAFKERYPDMFVVYQEECKTGKLRIGRPSLYTKSTPWILNFPTKDNWKANSKVEYLEKGLKYFVAHCKKAEIKSIAFPKLGAQNGKLSWDEVGPLMAKYLSQLDIDVHIYIAEGDREYYNDEQREGNAAAWKHFSELALSLDCLHNEVNLSPREAKKVFESRKAKEFTSQADLDTIDGLAHISSKRIKEYIHCQQYIEQKLPNMESESTPKPQKKKTPTSRSKKKRYEKAEPPAASLFPSQSHELVSQT